MDRLCRANGIRYYHFFQPNQYVTGSKPMGKEEIARAVVEKQIFADHSDPLYIDTCCHVIDEGNRILGSTVGREIASTR